MQNDQNRAYFSQPEGRWCRLNLGSKSSVISVRIDRSKLGLN